MDGLTFLKCLDRLEPKPIYVVHGDEDFLHLQVKKSIRRLVLKAEEDEFGLSIHDGENAEFASIRDELDTLPFLGSTRLVVVEDADSFITRFRSALEKYFAQPSRTGTLVLQVKSWPRNTRLAKQLGADATIQCAAPPLYKLAQWCVEWSASQHQKTLTQPAARLLVDLVGAEMGQLDQELLKLAIFVGADPKIDLEDVDKLVGNSRAADIWKIFDAIGLGHGDEAIKIIDRLFDQSQEPIRILGAFSMQLRRLAQAGRLNQSGLPVPRALERVGVLPYAQRSCEQQLRHLGQRRLNRLYDWLLEVDLGLKGSSQLSPRTLLEQLVVKLARDRESAPG